MQLITGGPNHLKISLLIPFYNEEQQIPLTLATVVPILEGIATILSFGPG
jgi:hypothetical protein